MDFLLILLILVVIFGVGGFALHVLWIVALIMLFAWLLGSFGRTRGPRV